MPADPLLPEQAMLNTLGDTDYPLTSDGFRMLTMLIILACYDRKVNRKFMADMLHEMNELHMLLSDLEGAERCRAAFEENDIIDISTRYKKEVEKGIVKLCKIRESMANKFSLVTQCPTTRDSIS